MIKISKRQKAILNILALENQYIKIDTLAKRLDVSSRTIRNDLGQISAFLHENGYQIETKTHNGVRVVGHNEDNELLLSLIEKNESGDIEGNSRIDYIILRLLVNQYSTYQQLAEELKISKQTTINIFEEAENIFKTYNINVIKQQGLGIQVKGEEANLRYCFKQIVTSKSIDGSVIDKIESQRNLEEYITGSETILEQLKTNKEVVFSEYNKVKLMIAYLLYRNSLGNNVEITSHLKKYTSSSIYQYLKDNNQFGLDEGDILCLASLITTNGSFNNDEADLATDLDKKDAKQITDFLFDKLQKLNNVNLVNKEGFIEGLSVHLASAIYRLRNNIVVNNELLSQIKYRIALMYEFTKQQLLLCEKDYGLEFNENEIAYIAMYLTSAYEDALRKELSCRVLLVCSFGLTTSAILKSRIVQNIPECDIYGPMNIKEAREYLKNNPIDLIVSTIDFSDEKVKTIVVNPLLTIEDITSIKENLVQISFDIMCNKFLNAYKNTKETKDEISIKDTIDKDKINIIDSIEDWQQAIRLAAKPLVDDGSLNTSYVDKMIEAVNEYGAYMVLAPNVAFVHAGIDDGINRECSSILVMKKPIMFGDKNQKMIRAIIVMGIKDKNNNSLLNNVYIMQSNENQKTLASNTITKEEILNMKIEKE